MSEREKIIETMISAMASSQAKDDEGTFEPLLDQINLSENAMRTVLRAAATDAIAALDAAGYAIVPREPTEAMLEAGSTARCYREDGGRDGLTDDNTVATWRAMIAAQEQK